MCRDRRADPLDMRGPCFWRPHKPEGFARSIYVLFFPFEDRISAFEQFPFAVQSLLSNDVDAVLIDEQAGLGYIAQNPDALEFVGPSISSDLLGFAFPNGSDLVEPFNTAIAELKSNGFLEDVNTQFFGLSFTLTYDDIE